MAAFKFDNSTWDRVDWRILQLGAISLYFHRDLLNEHTSWLREHNYRVLVFDASAWADKTTALVEIGQALDFPDYHYGRSLDAFNDWLGDVEIPATGGVALVFLGFDAFHRTDPETAWHLLDIVEHNSRQFLLFGKRFMALVQTDDRQLRIEPVGARGVYWNWMEQTRKYRDISY